LIEDKENTLYFSPVSIWELVIKSSLPNSNIEIDTVELYRSLLAEGYEEVPVTGAHTLRIASLPYMHRDPFDRLLIAQASAEALTLLTADRIVARYPGDIIKA
jgi:PIN domain nuclease of toxin-antitoxin system